jgi:catechol 2,3-dioxygenase-like lactoylglutathione lyase family enzyme
VTEQTADPARDVILARGDAVGKISGFHHVVLLCRDMDRTVHFYRDLLGLRIVRTSPTQRGYERQYFFELGNGEMFSLYQMSTVSENPEPPIVSRLWPGKAAPADRPQKLDHLAFKVETREELEWFHARLTEHGVPVSDIKPDPPGQRFLPGRIYFYDPDGNPLEISCDEPADPSFWDGFDRVEWLMDHDPVPALRRKSSDTNS